MKVTEIYFHCSGGQKSNIKILAGWFFLNSWRENPSPAWLLASASSPWHSLANFLPLFHLVFSFYASVSSSFLSPIRTLLLDLGTTLTQDDLIWIFLSYICKDPFPLPKVYILRFQVEISFRSHNPTHCAHIFETVFLNILCFIINGFLKFHFQWSVASI